MQKKQSNIVLKRAYVRQPIQNVQIQSINLEQTLK